MNTQVSLKPVGLILPPLLLIDCLHIKSYMYIWIVYHVMSLDVIGSEKMTLIVQNLKWYIFLRRA